MLSTRFFFKIIKKSGLCSRGSTLPNNKMLYFSKLKLFADDKSKLNVAKIPRVEKIVGIAEKGKWQEREREASRKEREIDRCRFRDSNLNFCVCHQVYIPKSSFSFSKLLYFVLSNHYVPF